MSDASRIEWTEATWNVVTGCTRVSEGCRRCYIERTPPFRMAGRRFGSPEVGATTGVRLHPERLDLPLRWRRPRRVFVNSLSDLFHDEVPEEFIGSVGDVMARTRWHTYQILTKRPARMRALLRRWATGGWMWRRRDKLWCGPADGLLPNVWLGVSAEDQRTADSRVPALLGPVDLRRVRTGERGPWEDGIGWVIAGGESGPGARPTHPQWVRSLRDQCQAAGVPFFFKQWGEWGPAPWRARVFDPAIGWHGGDLALAAAKAEAERVGATHAYPVRADRCGHEAVEASHKPWSLERATLPDTHAPMRRWGKRRAGRELDGRTWDEFPAVGS